MKNIIKGLSEKTRSEIAELAEIAYQKGYADGQASTVEDEPAPLTANQQRAQLIQRAREFKDNLIDDIHGYYLIIAKSGEKYSCDAIFKHNHMKRTTTCILVGAGTGYTRKKAVVHCHPNEVFNEPLGEVISLYKALQIDIPQEFLGAVQPDEKVIGQVVQWDQADKTPVGYTSQIGPDGGDYKVGGGSCAIGSVFAIKGTIIDDTNAEYEFESVGETV